MGRSGADTMFGGLGNDFYQVDNPNDIVFENENEGDDRVVSNITLTLGANVENLTLTGSAAINGTGNELDNVIFGNPGANILAGRYGNDRIAGSFGKDTFVFDTELSSSANVDSITDFFVGQDKIQLDKDIFTALKDEGVLSSAFFKASATGAAGDDNDYFLYNTTSGALFYDADGNGQGVAVQFATLTNKPKVSANDFLIAS